MRLLSAGLALVAVLGFGLGLLVYWPAETALQLVAPVNLQWKQAQGRVWKGVAYEVSYADQPLGDIGWLWHGKSLWLGRVSVDFSVFGDTAQGQGRIRLQPHRLTIYDLDMQVQTSEIRRLDPKLRHVRAQLVLGGVQLVIGSDGQCRSASGRIGTDLLQQSANRLGWKKGEALNGTLSCQEGKLMMSLQGSDGQELLLLSLSGEADVLNIHVRIKPRETQSANALSLLGFRQEGQAYTYSYALSLAGRNSSTAPLIQ